MGLRTVIAVALAMTCAGILAAPGWTADAPAPGAPGGGGGAPANGAAFSLLAIDVVRPPAPDVGKQAFDRWSTVGVFMRPVMRMQVLLDVPDRAIIDLDPKGVHVDRYGDDVGGQLPANVEASLRPRDAGFDDRPISLDAHHAIFEIAFNSLPARGAKRVRVEGKVKVTLGSGERTTDAQALDLKPGGQVTAGPLKLTVKRVASLNNSVGTLLTLEADGLPGIVRSATFYDQKGEEIDAGFEPRRSIGHEDEPDRTLTYILRKAAGPTKVKFAYFEKVEAVVLPLKLESGIGL